MIPLKNIRRAISKACSEPQYALRNLYKRIRGITSYYWYEGKSYWPETISLFLTYKCNLRCKMCGQWGDNGLFKTFSKSKLEKMLSIEVISDLINEIKKFNPTVTLFGGEPTLHPQIVEIIRRLKQSGLRVNIITNGSTLKKYGSEFISAGLDEIILSLDGPREIHNKIRGIPGLYGKVEEGINYINRIKDKNNAEKPLLNINHTIFEENYEFLEEFLEGITQFNPESITFHHLLFLKKTTVNQFLDDFHDKYNTIPADWRGFAREKLPDIKPGRLISEIKKIKSKNYDFNIGVYPNFTDKEIRRWYNNFDFESDSYSNRCLSLWMTAYIFPDGKVKPYQSMNYPMGNIYENDFATIWNNKKYKDYRKYIKQNKSFPICSKGCTEFFRY